ncbi:3-oxoadipate CoA-transferase beta subunit [Pseudonocardia hierapolitana]|uniref:3-oxoadipate CoA-transferase beta subunit n=1 Tax=Pseudonocardia hierapolitana TaxID=1128676 RepID=A0A561SQN8_9PSEU|nr:3-oxoacid CoA-transferase subunit B [Pseudonocardia hierapolitana]TWF77166.1 3-oxoadipate CoA-transferase beta subunit [Pseudonocardia hierapolitana]
MNLTARRMAARVAQDIPDGSYVNLGIGLPTLVADVVPPGREIIYHSENGILGMGPAPEPGTGDPELINAGKQLVTLVPGGAYFHHTDAFVMMRGGHIDITVLGAFQVAANGDLANWATDDATLPPAVGGAMDLAVGARQVFVLTTHTTKDGKPKLLPTCTYPLTAAAVVDRVYTDLAVLDVTPEGFVVREMVPGLSRDELQARTGAPLRFGDGS